MVWILQKKYQQKRLILGKVLKLGKKKLVIKKLLKKSEFDSVYCAVHREEAKKLHLSIGFKSLQNIEINLKKIFINLKKGNIANPVEYWDSTKLISHKDLSSFCEILNSINKSFKTKLVWTNKLLRRQIRNKKASRETRSKNFDLIWYGAKGFDPG